MQMDQDINHLISFVLYGKMPVRVLSVRGTPPPPPPPTKKCFPQKGNITPVSKEKVVTIVTAVTLHEQTVFLHMQDDLPLVTFCHLRRIFVLDMPSDNSIKCFFKERNVFHKHP